MPAGGQVGLIDWVFLEAADRDLKSSGHSLEIQWTLSPRWSLSIEETASLRVAFIPMNQNQRTTTAAHSTTNLNPRPLFGKPRGPILRRTPHRAQRRHSVRVQVRLSTLIRHQGQGPTLAVGTLAISMV